MRDREFSSRINHYVSYSGFTPLHYAVVMEREEGGEMVQYLLEHGADPTIENNRGLCPLRYSISEETKSRLKKYATKVSSSVSPSVCKCVCSSTLVKVCADILIGARKDGFKMPVFT